MPPLGKDRREMDEYLERHLEEQAKTLGDIKTTLALMNERDEQRKELVASIAKDIWGGDGEVGIKMTLDRHNEFITRIKWFFSAISTVIVGILVKIGWDVVKTK